MESGEFFVCKICDRTEKTAEAMVTCDCCLSSFHAKCKKIPKETMSKLSGSPYFCSSKCSDIFRRFTAFTGGRKLCEEDKSYITSAIKDALAEKLDSVIGDIRNLQLGHEEVSKEQDHLKERCSQLEGAVNGLEEEVEYLHKERISNNVMFFGVPLITNENTGDVVQTIINRMTYEKPQLITRNDILSVYRFPLKNKSSLAPPIRVIFKSSDCKTKFMDIARQLQNLKSTDLDSTWTIKGSASVIFIREEATKRSQQIYRELTTKQKELGVQYIWIGRNSVVLLKKDSTSSTIKVKNWNEALEAQKTLSQDSNKRVASEISPEQGNQGPKRYCM